MLLDLCDDVTAGAEVAVEIDYQEQVGQTGVLTFDLGIPVRDPRGFCAACTVFTEGTNRTKLELWVVSRSLTPHR